MPEKLSQRQCNEARGPYRWSHSAFCSLFIVFFAFNLNFVTNETVGETQLEELIITFKAWIRNYIGGDDGINEFRNENYKGNWRSSGEGKIGVI